MAIKKTGKFVKETVILQGKEETWESELQEVTCDGCGHVEVGVVGGCGCYLLDDDTMSSNFGVYGPDGRIATYWNGKGKECFCEACVKAGVGGGPRPLRLSEGHWIH